MLDRIVGRIERIAGLFLLAVALLTFVMVILRKFFDTGIPDWFDFSRLLQGIALLWGIACVCYRGAHILVDLVWDFSSDRNKFRIDVFALGVLIAFLLALCVFATQAAIEMRGKNLLTSDLRVPQWGFYLLGALGTWAALFATGVRLRQILKRHADGLPHAPAALEQGPAA
jgi:TRAP-type C4-dicarboxylate transport system permease small subunit